MIVLFVKDLFSCVFNQETQMKACLFSTIIDRKQKLWKKNDSFKEDLYRQLQFTLIML